MPRRTRPEYPVLLPVDQEFGEGAGLGVPPVGADRVDTLEVGEHQDVEQPSAGSWGEGVETLLWSALEFIGTHRSRLADVTGSKSGSSAGSPSWQ
jgi:hypothetical protein